jgi:diguanylate cyclase (GGDEF)-like protein/PAS domain S-box-containing protein
LRERGLLTRLWARLPLIGRLMLGTGFALALAGMALLSVSIHTDAAWYQKHMDTMAENELETLLGILADPVVSGDYATVTQILRVRAQHADIDSARFVSLKGGILRSDKADPWDRYMSDAQTEFPAPDWFVRLTRLSSVEKNADLVIGGRLYGVVSIQMEPRPALARLWDVFRNTLMIGVLAVGLNFALILLMLKRGLKPIAALSQGAEALARGELAIRIPPQGSPELLRVVLAFNHMATALQAAQGTLHEEARKLAVTLSSIGDGVIATDTEGRVEFMNPVAEALTGWTAAEAAGRSVLQVFAIINETTREVAECPVGRALREGVVVGLANHTLLICRDGTERPIADSAAPIRHPDGRITGAVLVFRDQTEERHTLDRLALAASVSENSLNGVIITDPQQRIIEVNPAFTRITGYSRADALGQTPRLLASGRQDTAFYAAMWLEIETTGQWRGEIWNRHKDGGVYPEELSIVRVCDEGGTVVRYIGIFSDISQLKAQEAQLRHLAHYDSLTGLPNRALLADRMKVALAHAERSGEKLAVCYLDLDGFKPINDAWGHATGDRLLEEVAGRLRDTVRGGDTVARLGGDEFVLLLADTADEEQCKISLSRILQSTARPVFIGGTALTITASIGVTLFPDDRADADTLLRHADQAMYAAKEAGRNRYHLFDPRHDHAAREMRASLARLEAALAQGELCLYYQPKVDMRAGVVIGAEALIRWRHPEHGLLLPIEFLPLLQGSALEIRIGEWVIDTALAQMDTWRAAGLDLAVSVNIAPPHLARIDFAERLKELLSRHPGTPDNRLELEVLESVALDDIEHVSRLIAECRRIGVSFALDDFGTGYSSLTYLKRLPVDLIKIDQSFVRDMLDNAEERAIIEGVVGLAGVFRSGAIAEGVESVEHGLALIKLGCSLGQGYGIAHPMPAHDMPGWIVAWRPDPSWQQAIAD